MLPLVWGLAIGCPSCTVYIHRLTNESRFAEVCSVNSEPTLSAYDVAICPGQSLERYRFRGTLTCSWVTEPFDKCGPGGLPVS